MANPRKLALIYLSAAILWTCSWAYAATFVNIENDQAVRANNGTVEIQVESEHPYMLKLDGMVIAAGPKGRVVTHTFENVDRGTHTVELLSNGKRTSIKIHVLRVHQ